MTIFELSPIPNQRINNGIIAIGGTCRRNSNIGSNCFKLKGCMPHTNASKIEKTQERVKPFAMRSKLMSTFENNSPF